jgi:ribosomal protein S18 acetylase RimI-like enzyme
MIRPATKRDALHMAALADIAGHGMPAWVWSQSREKGQSIIEVGRARAMREEGSFSYRNAHMLEADGEIAAMLLGYRQPDAMEPDDTSDMHEVFRAMTELEAEAPGSWYVNILGVFPEYRGRGFGRELLARAEAVAQAAGAGQMSLIVESENEGAWRLYERIGYAERARRPYVRFPGSTHDGDWVLMVKEI